MENPMKLRNRQTIGNQATNSTIMYDELINTPIGKGKDGCRAGENTDTWTRRLTTRKSSRQLQLHDQNASAFRIDEQDGNESTCSNGTVTSNVENESIVRARETNETTPRQRNRLTRNRRLPSSSSFVVESTFNDKDKSVKCTFRKQPLDGSLTPKQTRELPVRSTRLSTYIPDDTLSEEDDECESPQVTKRNASYFSKKDFEDYIPDGLESESEEDEPEPLQISSESEEELLEDSESEEQLTPIKPSLIRQGLTQLARTPDLLNRLEGSSIRRRIYVNSPVATGSQTMSPNPETYFLAENRVRYKSIVKKLEVMNDAMKGKRRKKRKITMDADSKLPEKIPTNFSVTAEASRVTVNSEEFISGNIHEEKVEILHKNIIENEFPHWLGLFRDGFNAMLYGYGSKLSILKEFEESVNDHYLTVTINGLFPKLVPRKLLHGVVEFVNPGSLIPHGSNLEAVAKDAVKALKTVSHPDIFIIINNFDNMALRFPQMLNIVCWLSQVPYVHILASCDTVNAFLGVTQSQALQLNFCWLHCPTYKSYREELKWIPGIYGDETKIVNQKSSLQYVLQSLTGNARKAFSLLAQMQLRQMKSRAVQKSKEAYAGVRFQELAKECREKFIAHSDENLRTLLTEFFDHNLIKQTGKGKHLENTLLIELDSETLEEIISESA